MKIQIILEGKVRNKKIHELVSVYIKRLSGSMPLELIEWGSTQESREERFFSSLKPQDKVVALDENGKNFKDSFEFANYLKDFADNGYKTLYLFVGEAEGHSKTVKQHITERWSLSGLTMSYEIALLVLAEQLYRGMTIMTGHPYHK